jgi:probable HAF family extracellular repeat protein
MSTALAAILVLAPSVSASDSEVWAAQALGMPLGYNYSSAYRASADGTVIVGIVGISGNANSRSGIRWTESQGPQPIPSSFYSEATGLSSDGTTVVGSELSGTSPSAWRWTEAGGSEFIASGHAWDTSADGSVVVGWSSNPASRAFRWTSPDILQWLDPLPGDNYSDALGVSADGSVVVGSSRNQSRSVATRWTVTDGWQQLGTLPGGLNSIAFSVSDDGRVVVGFSDSTMGQRAFRWTAEEGMQDLGVLPGDSNSQASGVSGDGSIIVGASINANASPGPRYRGFVWTAAEGMQELGPPIAGANASAQDISADGRTIVGQATWGNPGTVAVRWVRTCSIDYNRDLSLNLDDLSEFITDFYISPPIPGRVQLFAPTSGGLARGFDASCPSAPDAPAPYSTDAYRADGYRVGFSSDGTNACPLDSAQTFPNLDHLSDFITAYYALFTAGGC